MKRSAIETGVANCNQELAQDQLIAASQLIVYPNNDVDRNTIVPDSKKVIEQEDAGHGYNLRPPRLFHADFTRGNGSPWFVDFILGDRLRASLVGKVENEQIRPVVGEDAGETKQYLQHG